MAEIVLSLTIVLSCVFVIVFLVLKSDKVFIITEDIDADYIIRIKIYRKRRGFGWKRNSLKAK